MRCVENQEHFWKLDHGRDEEGTKWLVRTLVDVRSPALCVCPKRSNASGCSCVEEDGGRDENDSKPYLVTGSAALIGRPSKTETEVVELKRCQKLRGRDKGGLSPTREVDVIWTTILFGVDGIRGIRLDRRSHRRGRF
jgi:hypothetical protein